MFDNSSTMCRARFEQVLLDQERAEVDIKLSNPDDVRSVSIYAAASGVFTDTKKTMVLK